VTNEESKPKDIYEACPHCGGLLSPWEQVLLSVDRALMCKRCWYPILLDVQGKEDADKNKPLPKGPRS